MELHKVTDEELPTLHLWLKQHLPHTYKIYGLLDEELKGRWRGSTFYTLGWPNILAVGEGPVDKTRSKCADFFNHVRHTCVYAPKHEHAEELLLNPDFLNWTKPILFHAVPYETANIIEKISKATGTPDKVRYTSDILAAYPGDIARRPVPEEFELRPLTLDHVEQVSSVWKFQRRHTHDYIRELIKAFPSLGLFNKDGECVAWEMEIEYGFSALLYVKQDYRGRGLSACLVSHLAQIFFEENRPILAVVEKSNKPSVELHTKLGFKTLCTLSWYVHTMNGEKVFTVY